MKAMILAAGLGTRLYPMTENKPKALVEVDNKPLLEHIILKLKQSGFNQIIINVHHFSKLILDFLAKNNNFGIDILISDETNQLLDTGGALKQVGHFFDLKESLLIHNVDIFSNVNLKQLYQVHQKEENKRLSTLFVSHKETKRYLLFDKNNTLKGWTNIETGEKKPSSDLDMTLLKKMAFSGIQVVSPSIFELMKNEEKKFSIIDFYMKMCQSKKIIGYQTENSQILDIGKLHTLQEASSFLGSL